MNYYYFAAHYFDAKHQHEDEMAIRIEADTIEEATVSAQKEAHKFEREYPYMVLIGIDLELTIPAATLARIFKGGDD